MNKKCARCDKTVYPIEELKCLDKIWHKQCFKCQECGMTLNMRTYKGFNKQPYCEAHIPKAKATTVAETPEYKRIAENTKIQSNVKYHEDFEKAKGKVTQIADDPEILRIRANTKIISNVAYHGDLEKKAIMELKREKEENGDAHEHHPGQQHAPVPPPSSNNHHHASAATNNHHPPPPKQHAPPPQQPHHQVPAYQPGRIADYDPIASQEGNRQYVSPYSVRQSAQTVIYTSDRGAVNNLPTRKIGSIADLDPVNEYYGSIAQEYPPSSYGSARPGGQPQQHHHQPQQPAHYHHQQQPSAQQLEQQRMHQLAQQQQLYQQQQMQQQLQRMQQQQLQQQQLQQQQLQQQKLQQQLQQQQQQHHQHQQKSGGRMYRAMYDYDAQDADEVSFLDGDILIGCTPIDEGWMTGTVQRTGAQGMLPANYVELAN